MAPVSVSTDAPGAVGFALAAAIFFLSAVQQGVTGFGFGMVAMSLLPFVIGGRTASIVGAFLALANTGYLSWRLRHSVEWRVLGILLLGAVIGVPVGVYALDALPERLLTRLIGFAVVSYAMYYGGREVLPDRPGRRLSMWWAWPAGVLSGALGGATNVGGPPIIFYAYHQPWSRETVQATLVAYFALISAVKVALLLLGGLVDASVAAYFWLMPLVWAGGTLGLRLGRRMAPVHFRTVVVCVLGVFGLLLLVRG
jgi:uncharacterized membrane protein YfcA